MEVEMATGFDALRVLITGGEQQLRTYLAWINSIKGNGIAFSATGR
jgi:hypothetical protein